MNEKINYLLHYAFCIVHQHISNTYFENLTYFIRINVCTHQYNDIYNVINHVIYNDVCVCMWCANHVCMFMSAGGLPTCLHTGVWLAETHMRYHIGVGGLLQILQQGSALRTTRAQLAQGDECEQLYNATPDTSRNATWHSWTSQCVRNIGKVAFLWRLYELSL